MINKKIKTEVIHSKSKTTWNVINKQLGAKYKIARIPYEISDDEKLNEIQKNEAKEYAEFISKCLNNSEIINLKYNSN